MKKIVLGLFLLTYSLPSLALFELRGGYGISQPKTTFGPTFEVGRVAGFHADAIIEPPLTDFGFGLRYEKLGFDVESPTAISPTDLERISVLINYRFIDLIVYFGAIGTIGFRNTMTMENYQGTGTTETFNNNYTFTYGVEGGFKFGFFQIGLELGYFHSGPFSIENDAITAPEGLMIDSLYGKAAVGLTF